MRVNSDDFGNGTVTYPRRSVYTRDGADRPGDVQERDGGFVARDRQGNTIGVFDSLPAAATACWRAAHNQGGVS